MTRSLVRGPCFGWDWYRSHLSPKIPLLIIVGQRYHVIVDARPANDLIPVEDQNYWIRITGAKDCNDIEPGQENEKLGIIRYNSGSQKEPTTTRYSFNTVCADEPYESLVPVVPMQVTARDHPANNSLSRIPFSIYIRLTKDSTYSRCGHGRQL